MAGAGRWSREGGVAYKGNWYRSRLEARWAVFFDTLGLRYVYEEDGAGVRGDSFRPDFFLPDGLRVMGELTPRQNVWVKVEPAFSGKDSGAISRLTKGTGKSLLLIGGEPEWSADVRLLSYAGGWQVTCVEFVRLRDGSPAVAVEGAEDGGTDLRNWREWSREAVNGAFAAASRAEFWGEKQQCESCGRELMAGEDNRTLCEGCVAERRRASEVAWTLMAERRNAARQQTAQLRKESAAGADPAGPGETRGKSGAAAAEGRGWWAAGATAVILAAMPMLFCACCLAAVLISPSGTKTGPGSEGVAEVVRATATSIPAATPIPTATPQYVAQLPVAVESDQGDAFEVERFEILSQLGNHNAVGVYLVLLGRVYATDGERACFNRGDFVIRQGRAQYEMDGDVLAAGKDVLGLDYPGSWLGICGQGSGGTKTFLVFDVPPGSDNLFLEARGTQVRVGSASMIAEEVGRATATAEALIAARTATAEAAAATRAWLPARAATVEVAVQLTREAAAPTGTAAVAVAVQLTREAAAPTGTAAGSATPLPELQVGLVYERVNLRTGPGEGYAVAAVVSEEDGIRLVGRTEDGSWLEVEAGGRRGWLGRSVVQLTEEAVDMAPIAEAIVLALPVASPTQGEVAAAAPTPVATTPPQATATSPPPTPAEPTSLPPTEAPAEQGRVEISYINYDGQVYRSEADEYAEIRNVGGTPVNLGGWRLYAGDPGQDFWFPSYVLQPGASCRVYTNQAHPESCGFSFGRGSAVWNNGGDCGYLYDSGGVQVDSYCY